MPSNFWGIEWSFWSILAVFVVLVLLVMTIVSNSRLEKLHRRVGELSRLLLMNGVKAL